MTDYSRDAIINKLDDILGSEQKDENKRANLIKKTLLLLLLFLAVCLSAFGIGMFKGIIDNAPDVDTLQFGPSGFASKAYDTEGNLIATLVQEGSNREEATFEELPEDLINAVVAIEDQRFWQHNGIDLKSITRAVRGVITGNDAGGGSTLTQQLIKNNVFKGGMEEGFARYERKFQEWYLALMLENQPNVDKTELKKEIITDYLNTINLGNNTLGVKVAARRYFNKDVSDLTLSECAVLAAIPQNPTKYNPLKNPEENQKRRSQVLSDMLEQGYIDEDEYNRALYDNVYARIKLADALTSDEDKPYSYFTDALIENCIEVFTEELGLTNKQAHDLLYSGGLRIETTQDPKLQAIVDEEVNDPDNYDTFKYSFTWRCSVKHPDGSMTHYSEHDIESYSKNVKNERSYSGLFRTEEAINDRIEEYKSTVITEGDEIIAETLDTTLQPQLSFVLMDQKTKEVKALTGGRGEKKYSLGLNRASNVVRQPGSVFKVVSSFAPAIEECGATLGTVYYDSEYSIGEKQFRNWWTEGKYFGYSSIREGIEYSMNIVAIRCMVETVTPEVGIEFAKRLGISTLTEEDVNPAAALGGLYNGVTNLELTNAFATIADGGEYGRAKFFTKIYDHDGNILIDLTDEETEKVMKDSTAFLLTDAMRESMIYQLKWASNGGVNTTSTRAHLDNISCAGKSGTTTNNVDIWFVGFTPYYTAGVWGGCDENQSLYDKNTGVYNGGTSFHKDIWRKIMTRVHEGFENKDFKKPDSVVEVEICRKSGKLPHSGCYSDYRAGTDAVYTEYFDVDNVPTETCEIHTKGGSIVLPEGEEDKRTDDSGHASNYRGSYSGGSSSSSSNDADTPVATVVPVDPDGPAPVEEQPTAAPEPQPGEPGPNIMYDTPPTAEYGPGV